KTDPLGDQLTWEQLLNHCKGKSKLWIISKDSDFSIKHGGKMFLNPLLYKDLTRIQQNLAVFCFDAIDEGIRDFVKTTGVTAEKLPTLEESKEIKKELQELPPLDLISSSVYDPAIIAALQQYQHRHKFIAAATATLGFQGSPLVIRVSDEEK